MKKRIALVVGTVGLWVFLAAGVAFAMVITGTSGPNNITATNNADNIAASANRDVVNGSGAPTGSSATGAMTRSTVVLAPTTQKAEAATTWRANEGDGDWVSVVDNDTNDFVSGGEGTEDVCVVDLGDGVRDEFSDTCEKVYQTALIPQE